MPPNDSAVRRNTAEHWEDGDKEIMVGRSADVHSVTLKQYLGMNMMSQQTRERNKQGSYFRV